MWTRRPTSSPDADEPAAGAVDAARRAAAGGDARPHGVPRHRVRVPDLDVRRDRRRDLGAERVGTVLGLGPEGDLVVHHMGHLRGLSARALDLGLEGPAGGRRRPGRLRVPADHVLRGEPLDRRAALVQGFLNTRPPSIEPRTWRWYSARGPAPEPASERLYRGGKGNLRKRLLWVLGLAAFGLMLASCAPHASQDSLQPAGPYAQEIKNLFVPVFWIAVLVFVIVEGGIVLLVVKYRHRKGQERMPPQIHGNTRLEIGWTIVPAVILAVVMVPTVATIWDLARKPPPALHITVQGHQWWWGFVYTDADMKTSYDTNGGALSTASTTTYCCRIRPRHRPARPHGRPVARRAADARGREGADLPAQGARALMKPH